MKRQRLVLKRRRVGFTLIELLVVIAIIAILAAMLFPVFARARESARKIQCLANVKNIATAFQMYLVDYERMPPYECRPEIVGWYEGRGCDPNIKGAANNPYLKFPVVLDEYVKNRDVWRCPSARNENSRPILQSYGRDWWEVRSELWDTGCTLYGQCQRPFPPGWGGSITDSAQQYACSGSGGGFVFSIYGLEDNYMLKPGRVNDPAKWLVVTEVGPGIDTWGSWNIAYPDWCKLGCANCDWGPGADWVNCPWSRDCGAGDPSWGVDVQKRKTQMGTRHLGGTNLGFMDGHAAWMSAEALLWGFPDWRWFVPDDRKNKTPLVDGPPGICELPQPGDPTSRL